MDDSHHLTHNSPTVSKYAATEARENSAAPKILTTPLSEKERKKIEKEWNSGKGGYWDDYCLARFLEGVCLRYVAYPVRLEAFLYCYRCVLTFRYHSVNFTPLDQDTDAVLESEDSATETSQTMPKKVAEEGASKAFAQVFEAGPKIELDHHLVYHAREYPFFGPLPNVMFSIHHPTLTFALVV